MQLKILACNVAGGDVKGQILVNGALVHPKVFKNQSAVVWQSDVLLASATVSDMPDLPYYALCKDTSLIPALLVPTTAKEALAIWLGQTGKILS